MVPSRVGVAGVVAALSVTSDLTRGHPPGEAMRACLLATELARRAGLGPVRQGEVFYASLMRFAGCAATSHEAAAAFGGDDIAVRSRGDLIDAARPLEALRFLAGLGSGVEKLRVLARAPRVARIVQESARADCEVGADLTQRAAAAGGRGPGRAVRVRALRRQGVAGRAGRAMRCRRRRGSPRSASPRSCSTPSVAPSSAVETVARWSGRALDPSIAAVFLEAPGGAADALEPGRRVGRGRGRRAAAAAVVPRRCPSGRGAGRVRRRRRPQGAVLPGPLPRRRAAGPGRAPAPLGVDPALVYRAGLVHDLGRVAVPTGVWERPGPLRPEEWELVRLHPYHSGRILARSPVLEPLGDDREPPPRAHRRVGLPGRRARR